MLNWIAWNKTVCELTKTILMLNWVVWNVTVWHNQAWNRNVVFFQWKCALMQTKLFEIELIICINMDLALNNLQRLICHKTQTNKQTTNMLYMLYHRY